MRNLGAMREVGRSSDFERLLQRNHPAKSWS